MKEDAVRADKDKGIIGDESMPRSIQFAAYYKDMDTSSHHGMQYHL